MGGLYEHVTDSGIAGHFVWRTACHDATCIEYRNTIGNAPYQVEVMLDQDEGLAVLIAQLLQQRAELLALIRLPVRRAA
jgi:hypothetical protein